jgi:hypothetical protein
MNRKNPTIAVTAIMSIIANPEIIPAYASVLSMPNQ